MLIGSLLIAVTVTILAVYLQRLETQQWPARAMTPLETTYRTSRFRRRSLIHNLLILTAGLIAIAGIAGRGRLWMICWILVAIVLLLVMLLAVWDAFRTHRYLRQRLPEIQRETLED